MDRAAHLRAFRGQTVTMEQAARGEVPAAVPSVRTISLGSRLRNAFLADALAQEELGTWALDAQTINFLEQEITERQPNTVLEFGSGLSTLCLARFMTEQGHAALPCVFSIEQNEWQIEKTQKQLAALGLQSYVRMLHAPLTTQSIEGIETECYDLPETRLREFLGDSRPEFVIVDGPCGDGTVRFGTLPLVKDVLAPDAVFFLDDAFRPEELDVARRWQELPYLPLTEMRKIGKGLLMGKFL